MENGIYAKIITDKGDILVNLEYKLTPITVSNFIGLSLGTLSNYSNLEKENVFYMGSTGGGVWKSQDYGIN